MYNTSYLGELLFVKPPRLIVCTCMININKFLDKSLVRLVVSVTLSVFAVATVVYGATTISTNIQTDGTLSVTGVSTFTGVGHFINDLNVGGADFNLGTGSATTTLTSLSATLLAINADLDLYGGDLNLGTGSATSTLTSSGGKLGLASTSPWGLFSIEAAQGTVGANTPTFVVGDQGTSTPSLYVSGNNGNVGIASSSPYVALGVVGTTTSSLGMRIGGTGSGITQLLTGSCTIDLPSIGAQANGVVNCSASGVIASTTRVWVTPAGLPTFVSFAGASSTADDIIQIGVFNSSSTAAIDPSPQSWLWLGIR